MTKATLFLSLLFASFGTAQTAPDEYNITIHVRSSYIVSGHGGSSQYMDVMIAGKKFQLADPGNGYLLALGDYKAKLVKDDHKTPYESIRMYEFQFSDKKARKFAVTGQSE
jgi:hypothetical protein